DWGYVHASAILEEDAGLLFSCFTQSDEFHGANLTSLLPQTIGTAVTSKLQSSGWSQTEVLANLRPVARVKRIRHVKQQISGCEIRAKSHGTQERFNCSSCAPEPDPFRTIPKCRDDGRSREPQTARLWHKPEFSLAQFWS